MLGEETIKDEILGVPSSAKVGCFTLYEPSGEKSKTLGVKYWSELEPQLSC